MSASYLSRRGVWLAAGVLALVAIAVILLAGRSPQIAGAATVKSDSALAPFQPAAPAESSLSSLTWITCTPAGVAVYLQRVHVRCSAATGGILYFAVSTADSASASRFLSLFTTAVVAGKTLLLWYDPSDTSGAAWGCGSSDCRRIQGAEMFP